jgi:hypothetical protein
LSLQDFTQTRECGGKIIAIHPLAQRLLSRINIAQLPGYLA